MMPAQEPLDVLPLWVLFAGTVTLMLLAVEVGARIGRIRLRLSEPEKESLVGAMVGATLGLLAFMLAFAFGAAATRFEDRRQIVLAEANAIGTTYLRTGLLAEAQRKQVRALLRDYVDARLVAVQTGTIKEGIAKSEALHGQLWAQAEFVGTQAPNSIMAGLFIQALNEVIDLHAKRVMVGVRSRVPFSIWLALYVLGILAMAALGYHAGLSGSNRSLVTPLMVLSFAAVMYLIGDLDRPFEGLLRVNQQAMIDLRSSMNDVPAS
jgi:hypothetical protein